MFRQKHDFVEAEKLYRQALRIIEKEGPGSIDRTTILGELAGTVYRQNRLDEAAGLYREAINTLEDRTSRLGNADETRSRYRAEHMRYYTEYMRLLIQQGQPEQAFSVLEAARARTLLEMLRQGHVATNEKADPVLSERERSLSRRLNAKTEYRIRLAAGNPADPELASADWGDDPFGGGWNSWNIGINSPRVKHRIIQPFDDRPLYICGEAYSDAQGWVEGALQTADMLLANFGLKPL